MTDGLQLLPAAHHIPGYSKVWLDKRVDLLGVSEQLAVMVQREPCLVQLVTIVPEHESQERRGGGQRKSLTTVAWLSFSPTHPLKTSQMLILSFTVAGSTSSTLNREPCLGFLWDWGPGFAASPIRSEPSLTVSLTPPEGSVALRQIASARR